MFFKKLFVDVKIGVIQAYLRDKWGTTLKFQKNKMGLLQIIGKSFSRQKFW